MNVSKLQNRLVTTLVVVISAITLTGCASVFTGIEQTIDVKAEPKDAICIIQTKKTEIENRKPYSDADRTEIETALKTNPAYMSTNGVLALYSTFDKNDVNAGLDKGWFATIVTKTGKKIIGKGVYADASRIGIGDLVTQNAGIGYVGKDGKVTISRRSGDSVNLICTKDGYKENKTTLVKGINPVMFIGFAGPFVYDFITGSAWKYKPDKVNVEMQK